MDISYNNVKDLILYMNQTFMQSPGLLLNEVEYEVRIGQYLFNPEYKKRIFTPGVTKEQYLTLVKKLDSVYPDNKIEFQTTISYYDDESRITEFSNGRIEEVKKGDKINKDFEVGEYTVRLSLAREKSREIYDKKSETMGKTLTKVINRDCISYITPEFRYDLRYTFENNVYDIELEFNKSWIESHRRDLKMLAPLSLVLQQLTDIRYALSIRSKLEMIEQYNRLYGKYRTPQPVFDIKKPVNFKHTDFRVMSEYVIMPKIDGVRCYLFISDNGMFLINYKNFMVYSSKISTDFMNYVLDGEYYEGKFYAFDIIFAGKNFKGMPNDVREENFLQRYKYITNVSKAYPEIQAVKYYTDILEGLVKISEEEVSSSLDLDGVILVPLNQGYYGKNFKLKPFTMLTIDFKLQRLSDNSYQLLSWDKTERKIIPFRSDGKYPTDGVVQYIDSDLIDDLNDVYEMKFNGTTFIPIRIRKDKPFPNDITVALDVWEDINNPITDVEMIEELSKYSRLKNDLSLKRFLEKYSIPSKEEKKEKPVTNQAIITEETQPDDIKFERNEMVKTVYINGKEYLMNTKREVIIEDPNGEGMIAVPYQELFKKSEAVEKQLIPPDFLKHLEKRKKEETEKEDGDEESEEETSDKESEEETSDEESEEETSDEESEEETSDEESEEDLSLEMLDVDDTERLDSPIDDSLVRTGTIGEGSCFFHSVLYSYSKKYREMSRKERKNFVRELRQKISESLSLKQWYKIGNGELSKIMFFQNLRNYIHNFYEILDKKNLISIKHNKKYSHIFSELVFEKYKTLYSIISYLVSEHDADRILDRIYSKGDVKETILEFEKEITDQISKKLEECQDVDKDYLLSQGVVTFKNIAIMARDDAFEKSKSQLKSCGTFIGQEYIGLVSDIFKRDIYFIKDSTRDVYNVGGTGDYKGRKSIIILWVGEGHYEIIGRLSDDNEIQYTFSPKDSLIEKMYKSIS